MRSDEGTAKHMWNGDTLLISRPESGKGEKHGYGAHSTLGYLMWRTFNHRQIENTPIINFGYQGQ